MAEGRGSGRIWNAVGMQVEYWVGSGGIPCNGTIRPTVIDMIQPNRTNRIKLGCPIVILLVHGSLGGRTLPLHEIPL